jgi:hypothetical protein
MHVRAIGLLSLAAAIVAGALPGSAAAADRSEAFVFRARTSGPVAKLLLHVDRATTAHSLVVALHSDAHGRPGLRLSTGTLSAPRRGAWSAVSLVPTRLSAGKRYWLSIVSRGGERRANSSRLGGCRGTRGIRPAGGAPPAAQTIGAVRVQSACPIFAYVILEPARQQPILPPGAASLVSPVSLASGTSPQSPPTPPSHPGVTVEVPPEEPAEEAPAEEGPLAPSNISSPLVTGSAVEGQTLKVSNGSWTGLPISFSYRWQDCNASGGGCSAIAGATTAAYKLKAADVGHTVRAVVTASNLLGSGSANSALTGLVGKPPSGEALYISPSGKDSNPCSEAQPCLTMGHAYEKASAGQSVQLLSGSYPGQTIPGTSKAGSAHVVFSPAPGASVTVTNTIYVFGSHVTIEGLTVKDVVTGNYDQTPGRPNPSDVSLLDLTGRNFEIDSASEVTVEGGSWGPASACGGPYGGNNNSIRQTIPSVTPENILINDTIIHDVQSYDLIECHIEGLAIFAGNHVTVSNSKFYGNSIYDVFMQANSGGKPNNVTISHNWMANSVDNSAANGHPAGYANGIVLGSEISSNLTLRANHFNGVVNIDDDGSIANYTGTNVLENFGAMPYKGYPCASVLKGVAWSKNVWQNDKCGASDVDLLGAALPYLKATNDRTLNYTLTGLFANWPA